MHPLYTVVLLLPSVYLSVTGTNYIDPKKIYFSFDDEESSTDGYEGSSTDGYEKSSTVEYNEKKESVCNSGYLEKYKRCARTVRLYCKQFTGFFSLLEKHIDYNSDQQTITFDLTLTKTELNAIRNSLLSGGCDNEVPYLLERLRLRDSWLSRLFDELLSFVKEHKIAVIIIIVILSCFLLVMYWVTISRSWYSAFFKLLVLCFIGSVVMIWCRKYQENFARKLMTLKNGIPLSCRQNDLGLLDSISLYFKVMFSVMPDDCLKYYEAEIVDPVFESTIVEAISEAFSVLILTPLPIFFEYVGKGLSKLFQQLPVYLWLPAVVLIVLALFVHMLISNRYRVRTILGSLEPSGPVPAVERIPHGNVAKIASTPNSVPNVVAPATPTVIACDGNRTQITFGDRQVIHVHSVSRNQIEDIPGPLHESQVNGDNGSVTCSLSEVPVLILEAQESRTSELKGSGDKGKDFHIEGGIDELKENKDQRVSKPCGDGET